VVTFPRYREGLERFTREVVPLLVQAGLRKPTPAGRPAADIQAPSR
jgi:hypothetical protein